MLFLGSCDFETDLCTWSNTQANDDFDWVQRKGATPSRGTGPTTDHTKNNAQGKVLFYDFVVIFLNGYFNSCKLH